MLHDTDLETTNLKRPYNLPNNESYISDGDVIIGRITPRISSPETIINYQHPDNNSLNQHSDTGQIQRKAIRAFENITINEPGQISNNI